MGGSRKFCHSDGSNSTLTGFFFLGGGSYMDQKKHYKWVIISARQRNAIKMAFRWRADDGSTLNAGFVAL